MKKTYVFSQRLSVSASFPASFFFGVFSRRLSLPASSPSIFLFRYIVPACYFPGHLFLSEWRVFGCLRRPAAVRHNRNSIKMAPERAPASQPARLLVFCLVCRLFISVVFVGRLSFSASFSRRLSFPASSSSVCLFRRLFPASFFSGVLFTGGIYPRRLLFGK